MTVVIGSIQNAKKTKAAWELQNPVLKDGQQVFEIGTDGKLRNKVGDGVKTYVQLDYAGETGTERTSNVTVNVGGYQINDPFTVGTIEANSATLVKILKPYVLPTIFNTLLTLSPSPYNQMNVAYSVAFLM